MTKSNLLMKNLYLLFPLTFCLACNPQVDVTQQPTSQVLYDTLTVIEKVVDTVFIEKPTEPDFTQSAYYVELRLPLWLYQNNLVDDLSLEGGYEIENRVNPLYLEADFNGDGYVDVAVPIKQTESGKLGFAIIHGETHDMFIVGAGTLVENGLSDDLDYIDYWKVEREAIQNPGVEEYTGSGENGELILENPSMGIGKTELGGGQIYWNGSGYAYFHQTC